MSSQTCSKCQISLSEETGYKKGKRFQSLCRTCFNTYCMDRWIRRKKDAILYKGGKCSRCGYDKFYGALEFHHKEPKEKDLDWKKLRLRSWDAITKELDKCVCVCANCHREVHNELLDFTKQNA